MAWLIIVIALVPADSNLFYVWRDSWGFLKVIDLQFAKNLPTEKCLFLCRPDNWIEQKSLQIVKVWGQAKGVCCHPVPRGREEMCSWNAAEEALQSGEQTAAGDLCQFPSLLATDSNMGKIGSRNMAIWPLLLYCLGLELSWPLTRRLTRVSDILWLFTHP